VRRRFLGFCVAALIIAVASSVFAENDFVFHDHTLSLWNRYQFPSRLGAGLGVTYRSDMFAAIDDTVTLPGCVRADAAVFFSLTDTLRLQANMENVFNASYYLNADSISPGSPRAVRIGLTARF